MPEQKTPDTKLEYHYDYIPVSVDRLSLQGLWISPSRNRIRIVSFPRGDNNELEDMACCVVSEGDVTGLDDDVKNGLVDLGLEDVSDKVFAALEILGTYRDNTGPNWDLFVNDHNTETIHFALTGLQAAHYGNPFDGGLALNTFVSEVNEEKALAMDIEHVLGFDIHECIQAETPTASITPLNWWILDYMGCFEKEEGGG